jgi:hypothetical protein
VCLSSDAFSQFQKWDARAMDHNREVREATTKLYEEIIPFMATRMDSWLRSSEEWSEELGTLTKSEKVRQRRMLVKESVLLIQD